jgi:methenyltetrahydromethanopterin cyclohydrolase
MRSFCEGEIYMKTLLSVNRLAHKLLQRLVENPDFYGVTVETAESGATLIDAGIGAKGGFHAGKIITEICMGGCAKAELTSRKYGETDLQSLLVYSDHPVIATLGSQYAGWQIKEDGYFAIGSGPARALALKPKKIYEQIGYKDTFDRAIVILETEKPPPAKLVSQIAEDCGIPAKNLTIILTPTTSLAGAVQISGRIIETGIHKLRRIGLDPNIILHAWGCAPIPPIHPNFAEAMARTNDSLLYGGVTHFTVQADDEEKLRSIVEKSPSSGSKDYGKPFIEIFKEANNDFYKIDPNLFAPAVVTVSNLKTGRTFTNGKINAGVLLKSLSI